MAPRQLHSPPPPPPPPRAASACAVAWALGGRAVRSLPRPFGQPCSISRPRGLRTYRTRREDSSSSRTLSPRFIGRRWPRLGRRGRLDLVRSSGREKPARPVAAARRRAGRAALRTSSSFRPRFVRPAVLMTRPAGLRRRPTGLPTAVISPPPGNGNGGTGFRRRSRGCESWRVAGVRPVTSSPPRLRIA